MAYCAEGEEKPDPAGSLPGFGPRIIVAIPARDEVHRIEACLQALAEQFEPCGTKLRADVFGVLLLLNNCRDDTAALARRLKQSLPYPLAIEERDFPPEMAHAGAARRLAMETAAAWLLGVGLPEGYLLTTDADTCVAPDWIACHRAAFDQGADAVAGLVIDNPGESRRLPARLRHRGRLEARYAWLLTELESLLDPDPHDPWPRHAMTAGASLGVRLSWYMRVGGVPLQSSGEDRALVQRLQAAGARVRHCVRTRVVTSCRLDGRAPGGMADTMRQRIAEPDALCDPMLEPVCGAVERYSLRAALRRDHRLGCLARCGNWAARLALPAAVIELVADLPNFEALWEVVEAHSAYLQVQLLRPGDLPAQITLAKQILRILRSRDLELLSRFDERERQVPTAASVSLLLRHRGDTTGSEQIPEAAEIPA
jgi:hypothetical protein